MNIESLKKNRRISLFILGFIVVAFVVYALALTWRMPVHEIKRLNRVYADTSISSQELSLHLGDIFDLRKEESFLRSRLKMAGGDSIGLTLDMNDSLLMLELEGVVIHQAKVHDIKRSPVFEHMDRSAFLKLFGSPFRVDSCRATIIKEPIVVQKAPADSIEAARQGSIRDTIPPPPASYQLYLDKDILLIVIQSDAIDKKNEIYRKFVKTSLHRSVGHILHDLVRFQVPDYRPWIMVFVKQDDAITTYRAIPYHSMVTIRI